MLGRWVVGIVLFIIVMVGGPAALHAEHLAWPTWLIAAIAAIFAGIVTAAKPITDGLGAAIVRRRIDQPESERKLIAATVGRDKPPRVKNQVDRALLGIHPAIPLNADSAPGASAELPTYVPRDIDIEIRSLISGRRSTGAFILLVGPAAAGKTRCAYEAIKATVPNWNLIIPASGRSLVKLVDSGAKLKRSVVWLNDIDNYLAGEGVTAETIRLLLADRSCPTFIVGTIWPDAFDRLAKEVAEVDSGLREILDDLAYRFDLSESFSSTEMERLKVLAQGDSRLAEALESKSPKIPETLAAVPQLIRRWRHGSSVYGRAIISAAVTARSAGHPPLLTPRVLEYLALNYLSPEDRARAPVDWFASGLEWAREFVRGKSAPLTAQAQSPGEIDGYQVHDVLVQHGPAVTDDEWSLLIRHATPEACFQIGVRAFIDNFNIADQAFRAAGSHVPMILMIALGFIYDRQQNLEAASHWFVSATELGDFEAIPASLRAPAGFWLEKQGREEMAYRWFESAAVAKDIEGVAKFGSVLLQMGRVEQGEAWLKMAAECNDTAAMNMLGWSMRERGKFDESRHWLQKSADLGDALGATSMGFILMLQGDLDASRRYLETASDEGRVEATNILKTLGELTDLIGILQVEIQSNVDHDQ